ncbi:MAG: hypothetical protein EOM72_06565 [Opitutae bacterium]|nr:hypothetical protein [Opitutae bacterium]
MTRSSVALWMLIHLCAAAFAAEPITREEIRAAQQAWGEAIVALGEASVQGDDVQALARQTVETLYAYDLGPVLFKPTKAAAQPFRPDLDRAVSYFVKGSVPEDHGFALQPWSQVRFGDQEIAIDSDSAAAMGHYYFTDAGTGAETQVEFTFGYVRDPQGRLRINVHHSSLPYQPHP